MAKPNWLPYGGPARHTAGTSQRPDNSRPVPSYGVPLDNSGFRNHLAGLISPGKAVLLEPDTAVEGAWGSRWGYVNPTGQTIPDYPARWSEARGGVHSYFGNVPFRQNFSRVTGQIVASSPGKTANKTQVTAQDVLVIQALRKRGFPI